MVAYPNHVPAQDVTPTNADHVELHDTTTDAVVALQGQLAVFGVGSLADVDSSGGIPSTGTVALLWDPTSSTWKPSVVVPAVTPLLQLPDVDSSNLVDNGVLTYDAGSGTLSLQAVTVPAFARNFTSPNGSVYQLGVSDAGATVWTLVSGPPPSATVNLQPNGDFEAGTPLPGGLTTSTVALDGTHAWQGSSALMQTLTAGTGVSYYGPTPAMHAAVIGGTVYSTSVYVYTTLAGQTARLNQNYHQGDSGHTFISTFRGATTPLTQNAWTRLTNVNIACPSNAGWLSLGVEILTGTNGASYWWDGAQVEAGSDVTGWVAPGASTGGGGGGTVVPPTAQGWPAAGTGVKWGCYPAGGNTTNELSLEGQLGKRASLTRRYHDMSDTAGAGTFPSANEITLGQGGTYNGAAVQGGRDLWLAWESRVYGTLAAGMPAPAGSYVDSNGNTHHTYTYTQIVSGVLDAYLARVAGRCKAYSGRIFISFDHEIDDSTAFGGSSEARAAAGNAAGFVAAWRYIVNKFHSAGVTNVFFVWTMSSYQSTALYQSLWPGQTYVDAIAWDPYNSDQNNWKTPSQVFDKNSFYAELDQDLYGTGCSTKPRLIGEFGSTYDTNDSSHRVTWFSQLKAGLQAHPKIVGVMYFNSGTWGQFNVMNFNTSGKKVVGTAADTASVTAFHNALTDPYFVAGS